MPELLDGLPPEDPRAAQSRADLRRINGLMLNARASVALIRRHVAGPLGHVVDLGCGDGAEMLRVARRLGPATGRPRLTLLDLRPAVGQGTIASLEALGWAVEIVAADIFRWLEAVDSDVDLMLANLFLHHFEKPALARLLSAASERSRYLVATEPLRTGFALIGARSVGAIGANAVTRHDAPASVRAGFRDRELSGLWPGRVAFEGRRGPFTHAFVGAGRRA